MLDFRCKSPVLFLAFNRLIVTQQVFEQIRKAQPSKLYFALDGARDHIKGEAEKVFAVRKYVEESIDWDCELFTLLREENLGCRDAISGALDWFFEQEEMGIVLEDDCLPDLSFFRFCDELLEYYKDDMRVMCITGNNFQDGITRGAGEYSYYFSQINHCWGWASWRRAWKSWHIANNYFDEICENYKPIFTHDKNANIHWLCNFRKAKNKDGMNSWAYTWTMANMINNGLTVTPQLNLVCNIGFGEDSTHTRDGSCPGSQEINFPLHHPSYMLYDKVADDYVYRGHMGINSFLFRLIRKVKKIFLG